MTQLSEIISVLESWAPPMLQEGYDNSGLQIGRLDKSIGKALISLDVTPEVIEEAKVQKCDLIIAHHPLIFRPLKRITGSNLVERCVEAAIKNDIAIYAIHTNLDNVHLGVNHILSEKLGLQSTRILQTGKSQLKKLAVFVPQDHRDTLLDALFSAGAGRIGNYDECSFNTTGTGTFRGNDNTNPFVGEKGKRHRENEVKVEVLFPAFKVAEVLQAMKEAHPYEEIAYDVYTLDNVHPEIGSGMIGSLPEPIDQTAFIDHVKNVLNCTHVKFTKNGPAKVQNIAVCGGSGAFLISAAKSAKADVFLTGDITYHSYFDADESFIIMDVGHFESEQYTSEGIMRYLKEKLPNFATLLTKANTNPVNTR